MRFIVAVVLVFGLVGGALAADVPAKVYVNGKLQSYKPAARIRDGKTYVPLRQGATSLGFSCEWLPEMNAAKLCDADSCVLIRKSEGIIVDSSLFLPLRTMGEAFGTKVTWDGKKRAVFIRKGKAGAG